MAVRQNYAWPNYKSKLEVIRNDATFGQRPRLDRMIALGDAMWHNYENGTPLARRLASSSSSAHEVPRSAAWYSPNPRQGAWPERYFETYDGYPEGAGFEILRDSVRFTVPRALEAEVDPPLDETLIFVGLDESVPAPSCSGAASFVTCVRTAHAPQRRVLKGHHQVYPRTLWLRKSAHSHGRAVAPAAGISEHR